MSQVHGLLSPPKRGAIVAVAVSGAALAVTACILNPDQPCGPNEKIYGDDKRCICVEGAALTTQGCVMCGENQVPGASGCVCAPGYAQSAPDAGACTPLPTGLGASCTLQGNVCADPKYDHCEVGSDGGGYCTTAGCASASDCTGGYACDTMASPPFCRRPPEGQGKACQSSADCAGTEATYCDAFVTHQCLVQGCTLAPNDCFPGWTCCDLSKFGVMSPTCVSGGMCP